MIKKSMSGPEFDAELEREIKRHEIRACALTDPEQRLKELAEAERDRRLLKTMRRLFGGSAICRRTTGIFCR